MKRYKFKRKHSWTVELANINAYVVDSAIPGLHYIVDNDRMAMVRHDDLALWDIDDTPTEAKKIHRKSKK